MNEPTKTPLAVQAKGVSEYLTKRQAGFRAVLPSHMTFERLLRSIMIAVQVNPAILNCKPETILLSAYRAAELGLECSGGVKGDGYLVPYKDRCEFVPGYRGLIDLARRAGDYIEFYVDVVRRNDKYTLRKGTDGVCSHEPMIATEEERGDPIFVYAVAKTREGACQWDYMLYADVLKIRNASAGWRSKGEGSVWGQYPIEMAKKTMLRRLMKLLPLSSEKLRRALELDDALEAKGDSRGVEVDVIDSAFEDVRAETTPEAPPANAKTQAILEREKAKDAEKAAAQAGAPSEAEQRSIRAQEQADAAAGDLAAGAEQPPAQRSRRGHAS